MNTPNEYAIGTKVSATQQFDATDSDTLHYPWVCIPKDAIGIVTGPRMPFVNRAGTFFKVKFPQGHVAVVTHLVKEVRRG